LYTVESYREKKTTENRSKSSVAKKTSSFLRRIITHAISVVFGDDNNDNNIKQGLSSVFF